MKIRVLLIVGLLALLTAAPVHATTLVRLTLEQLAMASSNIVRARVISQESRWNAEHTRIFTYTKLAVSQSLKGQAASTIEIVQPGGSVGNFHVRVPGSAALHLDKEYVLFLEPSKQTQNYIVVGMAQGAYHVYRDAKTHQLRVTLPLGQLYYKGNQTVTGNPPGTYTYSGFRAYVDSAVQSKIVVPSGTSFPVTIQSTESAGVGRMRVHGRINADVFPNHNVAIPAGSLIAGNAVLLNGRWEIYWDEVTIRDARAQISATSAGVEGNLRGRSLVVTVK